MTNEYFWQIKRTHTKSLPKLCREHLSESSSHHRRPCYMVHSTFHMEIFIFGETKKKNWSFPASDSWNTAKQLRSICAKIPLVFFCTARSFCLNSKVNFKTNTLACVVHHQTHIHIIHMWPCLMYHTRSERAQTWQKTPQKNKSHEAHFRWLRRIFWPT